MASSYGARHGLPGFDEFRTGLTYQNVFDMLKDESADPREWKYKSRGVILGMWHQIKLELYEEALKNGYDPNEIPVERNARSGRLGKMPNMRSRILAKRPGKKPNMRRVRTNGRAASG
jgi:hypothetical protein